ncbi:14093_t:CDS:2, partial [Dentiscutata erythropus]
MNETLTNQINEAIQNQMDKALEDPLDKINNARDVKFAVGMPPVLHKTSSMKYDNYTAISEKSLVPDKMRGR